MSDTDGSVESRMKEYSTSIDLSGRVDNEVFTSGGPTQWITYTFSDLWFMPRYRCKVVLKSNQRTGPNFHVSWQPVSDWEDLTPEGWYPAALRWMYEHLPGFPWLALRLWKTH